MRKSAKSSTETNHKRNLVSVDFTSILCLIGFMSPKQRYIVKKATRKHEISKAIQSILIQTTITNWHDE